MRHTIGLATLALAALASLPATASAQQAERQLEFITEVHVRPGMDAQFEEAQADRKARLARAGVSFGERGSRTDAGVYRFVTTVGTWEDLARRAKEMDAVAPMSGAMRSKVDMAVDYVDTYLRWTRPDLSYAPADPRVEQVGFMQRVRLYVKIGKAEEVAAALRDMAALYEQHNSGDGRLVRFQAMGPDAPVMEIFLPGADGADFYAQGARRAQQMGAEMSRIRDRITANSRRIEITNMTPRPDLSYVPSN